MKYGISASSITSISLDLDSGRSCNTEYSSCWLENNGLKPFFLRRNGYSWLKYIFSLVVLSPIRRVLTVTSSYFVQPRQRPWQIQLQRPSFLQQVQFHHRYAQTSNTTNSDKITTGSSVSPLFRETSHTYLKDTYGASSRSSIWKRSPSPYCGLSHFEGFFTDWVRMVYISPRHCVVCKILLLLCDLTWISPSPPSTV